MYGVWGLICKREGSTAREHHSKHDWKQGSDVTEFGRTKHVCIRPSIFLKSKSSSELPVGRTSMALSLLCIQVGRIVSHLDFKENTKMSLKGVHFYYIWKLSSCDWLGRKKICGCLVELIRPTFTVQSWINGKLDVNGIKLALHPSWEDCFSFRF